MPGSSTIGKADQALAASATGTFLKSGGPGAPATTALPAIADVSGLSAALTLKAPLAAPNFTDIVTIRTTADHGVYRNLHNTGTALPTTAPWGSSYEGYDFSGVVDNVHMEGWLQHQQVAGQPALWYQHESKWGPGAPPNGLLEWHRNYISIDGSVVYRPDGGSINLNTHVADFGARGLGTWQLLGFGEGIADPDPPTMTWDGFTGNLATSGGINAASFAGDGSGLNTLNASALASGTVPDAQFPSFMTVDSGNHRLALNTTAFADSTSVSVDDIFKVANVAGTKTLGWTGDRISLDDGSGAKAIFGTGFVGSFTNTPFIVVVNSSPAGTFGTDGSLTVAGGLTGSALTATGASTVLRVNTTGTFPITIGAPISAGFPCIWATAATPTLSNYLMFIDGPGGGVVLAQTNYALLKAGSNQIHITPTATGFFGVTPAAQPAGEITTGLVALGLFSSVTIAQGSVTGLAASLALLAPKASPTFTGPVTLVGRLGPIQADADAATITLDLSASDFHAVTLGGNRTLALTGTAPQSFKVKLIQSGAGSWNPTWWSGITWYTADGLKPTPSPATGKATYIQFLTTGSGTYDGFLVAAQA